MPGITPHHILCIILIILNILSRFCFLIVTCALLGAAPAMGQLQQADDLDQVAAEARAKRIPVLIAFMQQSCPYCAIARKNHLLPIQADPQWGKRVLIREVDVDRNTALRDFAGAPTTHRAFARLHQVQKVPTLIVFDADGKPVGSPLVGLLTEDFYRLYIEQAIENGLTKMRGR
jgi:thioredoxin-related protein